MLWATLLLIAGFAAVIKGADFLVNGSSSLARRLNIPEIVIGLTIVSFGTSAPELVVNLIASIAGKNDMVLGNIIGSNIFNTLIILGVAALVRPLDILKNTLTREIPFLLLILGVFFLLSDDHLLFRGSGDVLTRLDAVILLIFFSAFIVYTYRLSQVKDINPEEIKVYSLPVAWIFIFLGFAGLFLGGKLVVDNAVFIARKLEVSEKLIALTIVSIGTSLPELATSAVAAYKKRSDLAVGNVIGSNIFNLSFIIAISSLTAPISYQKSFNMDLAVFGGSTLWMILASMTGKKYKIDRFHGAVFIFFYIVYLAFIIASR